MHYRLIDKLDRFITAAGRAGRADAVISGGTTALSADAGARTKVRIRLGAGKDGFSW
jgi:hypothetical protein